MARPRHHALTASVMTAMALAVAVMVALAALAAPAAAPQAERQLAAELLILRGDLDRFARAPGLSSQESRRLASAHDRRARPAALAAAPGRRC